MAEVRAVHECLFCPQTFDSAAAKDDHILQHFPQEMCMDCNQNLIRIGSNLYTLHDTITCIKRDLKTESNEETHLANKPLLSHSTQYGPPDTICREPIYPMPTICTEAEIKPEPPEHVEHSDTLEEINYLHQSSDFPTESHNDNLIVEPIMVSVELPVKSEFFDEHEEYNQITDDNDDDDDDNDDDYDNQSAIIHSNLNDTQQHSKDATELVIQKKKIVGKHAACDVCGKVMLATSLYNHVRYAHQTTTKEYKCEPCKKRFKTADILRKHMRMKHDPTVEKFKCKLCCLVFLKEATLRAHPCKRKMGQTPKSDPMPCDICGKMLGSKLSLKKHKTLMHSPPGTIYCNVCGRLFSVIEDRDEHQTECAEKRKNRSSAAGFNSKPLRCDDCRKEFKTLGTFRSHMRMKHDPTVKKFKCKLCCLVFLREASLRAHRCKREMGETPKSDPVPCDICGKILSNKIKLKTHKTLQHSPPGTIYCNICGRLFSNIEDRDVHRIECDYKRKNRTRAAGYNSKPIRCDDCRKEFKTLGTFRSHMRMKHDPTVEKFKCKLCCLVFLREASLRAHRCKREMGETPKSDPVPCDICGKMLSNKTNLKKHKTLVHSPPGTIYCNVCGRLFSNIEDRDVHWAECARKQKNRSLNFFKTRSNNKETTNS